MTTLHPPAPVTSRRKLWRDRSGVAMIEFALAMPVFIGIAMYGMEAVNYAYAAQRVGTIATMATDNISRIRIGISDADVTEVLNGIKTVGTTMAFAQNARVIVSSVQPVVNTQGVVTDQKIRWQRCSGALNATSTYGVEGALLGTAGIGPAGRKLTVGANDELIFVEVVYSYQPLISNSFLGQRRVTSLVGMTVRERSVNDIQASGSVSSCSTFAA